MRTEITDLMEELKAPSATLLDVVRVLARLPSMTAPEWIDLYYTYLPANVLDVRHQYDRTEIHGRPTSIPSYIRIYCLQQLEKMPLDLQELREYFLECLAPYTSVSELLVKRMVEEGPSFDFWFGILKEARRSQIQGPWRTMKVVFERTIDASEGNLDRMLEIYDELPKASTLKREVVLHIIAAAKKLVNQSSAA